MKTSKNKWLNRKIFAMGLTSFFSDFGHEMATAKKAGLDLNFRQGAGRSWIGVVLVD